MLSLAGQDDRKGWLKDIRHSFSLDHADPSAETVEWFEIDWIALIGEEQLAQGGLPRRPVEYFRFDETVAFCSDGFLSDCAGHRGNSMSCMSQVP